MSIYEAMRAAVNGTSRRRGAWSAIISGSVDGGERLVTIEEAADYLRVKRSTIYTYMEKGLLPYRELSSGGGRRILESDVKKLLVQGLPPRTRGKKKSEPAQEG